MRNDAGLLSILLSILLAAALGVAPGQQSNAMGAESLPELMSAFRTAHDHRDLDGMMSLFCWDQVTPEIRQATEKDVEESFDDDISNLKMTTEHPKGRVNEFVRDGVPYGFNLPVIEEMVMETAEPKSGPKTVYYPIGMKNGHYFIALMAREAHPQMALRNGPVKPAENIPQQDARPSHSEARKITIPAMTSLTVRVDQAVGMGLIASGGRFSATFSNAVQINGVTVIPAGSTASGMVTKGAAYSPEIKLEAISVNGQEIRLKTFPITFNERISFPANAEMTFHLMFSTTVTVP